MSRFRSSRPRRPRARSCCSRCTRKARSRAPRSAWASRSRPSATGWTSCARIAGDALFVRAGRGIVATAQAERAGRARARAARRAARLQPGRRLRPGTLARHADHRRQRPAARPAAARAAAPPARRERRASRLRVIPSGAPQPALLREQGCDLVITPRPPEAADLRAEAPVRGPLRRLLRRRRARGRRATQADYLAAEHVTVRYEDRRGLRHRPLARRAAASSARSSPPCPASPASPRCCAAARGWPPLPSLLRDGVLRGLASAELPIETPPHADVHGLAPAPAGRPAAPLAARRAGGGGARGGARLTRPVLSPSALPRGTRAAPAPRAA